MIDPGALAQQTTVHQRRLVLLVSLAGLAFGCDATFQGTDAGPTCGTGVCTGGTGVPGAGGAFTGSGGALPTASGGAGGTGVGGTGVGGVSVGGTAAGGGIGSGGIGSGGLTNGSGGSSSGGSSSGGSGSGGSGTGGQGTGGQGTGSLFSECRFHFGTIREFAIDHAQIRQEIDYFTPGWMGLSNTFDQEYVCDDLEGVLAGKLPVVVAYVSAFYAKRERDLNDCNVGMPDLCTYGSEVIKEDLEIITDIYRSYAEGYAACLPPGQPIVFEMEPDWFQYTLSNQGDPMTPAQAGQIMSQYVEAMQEFLPQAHFSLDISPWVPPDNGSDHGATWYQNFDLSLFTFINTSGGTTNGDADKIRDSNNMTWAGVHGVTQRPILADTGYGVNGASEGHDPAWDSVSNLNARIASGVIGVAQYNPDSNWGATIAAIRSQLAVPAHCP